MSQLTLHERLGVNPRVVKNICAGCHEEYVTDELVMLGSRNYKFVCATCGVTSYGMSSCGHDKNHRGQRIELEDGEALHSGKLDLCEKCGQGLFIIMSPNRDAYAIINRSATNDIPPKQNLGMADREMWEKLMNLEAQFNGATS